MKRDQMLRVRFSREMQSSMSKFWIALVALMVVLAGDWRTCRRLPCQSSFNGNLRLRRPCGGPAESPGRWRYSARARRQPVEHDAIWRKK